MDPLTAAEVGAWSGGDAFQSNDEEGDWGHFVRRSTRRHTVYFPKRVNDMPGSAMSLPSSTTPTTSGATSRRTFKLKGDTPKGEHTPAPRKRTRKHHHNPLSTWGAPRVKEMCKPVEEWEIDDYRPIPSIFSASSGPPFYHWPPPSPPRDNEVIYDSITLATDPLPRWGSSQATNQELTLDSSRESSVLSSRMSIAPDGDAVLPGTEGLSAGSPTFRNSLGHLSSLPPPVQNNRDEHMDIDDADYGMGMHNEEDNSHQNANLHIRNGVKVGKTKSNAPVGSKLTSLAASLKSLKDLLEFAGDELDDYELGELEKEVKVNWRVDAMADFITGFISGSEG